MKTKFSTSTLLVLHWNNWRFLPWIKMMNLFLLTVLKRNWKI